MNNKSNWPGWLLAGGAAVVVAGLLIFGRHHPPSPTPGPGPNPGPPPDPAGSMLVIVTDNDNRTPEQAALLLSEDLGSWLISKRIGWRIIDSHGKVFTDQGYDKILATDGVPPAAVVLWAPGNASHRTAPLPTNLEALKQWVIGSPHTGPPSIEVDGETRYLTCLPPSQARLMAPRGGEFADIHAPIPRANWKEIDNSKKFPAAEWIYDQDGIGSCVGNGATAALRKARFLAGMTDRRLAPGCTYSQINGGQDQGAVISDSLTALQQTGTITAATLGSDQKPFYTRQMPSNWKAEAARFRIEEAYHCTTYDDICTAIQLGYVVVYGIQVGNSFNSFTPDGVAGASPGPGNHCMHADGLKKLSNGEWALRNVNSWGQAWGPNKDGRCLLVEKHFKQGDQPDAFAVKTAVEDPKDPPLPKKKVDLELVPTSKANQPLVCECISRCLCDRDKCRCGRVTGLRCVPECECEKVAGVNSKSDGRDKMPPPGVKPRTEEKTQPTKYPRPDGLGYCSGQCACGCNNGRPCQCGYYPNNSERYVVPQGVTGYYQPSSPQTFSVPHNCPT